jgi:hypothetical protein
MLGIGNKGPRRVHFGPVKNVRIFAASLAQVQE